MKFSIYILIGIIIISSAFANPVISPSRGLVAFYAEEGVDNVYNLSIYNDGTLPESNISEVNMSFPNEFSFILIESNGTDSNGAYSDLGISWKNDGMIMNSTTKYFWRNASCSTPGIYNLTVNVKNATTITSKNITVYVSNRPALQFLSPTNSSGSNLSASNIKINVSASSSAGIDFIQVFLYNSTSLFSIFHILYKLIQIKSSY